MSTFSTSSCSSSSSSSLGPSTPYTSSRRPSSDSYISNSTSQSETTPPGSLRDYSASLKARHTLGMAAAMKSIPLDRDPSRYDLMRADDNPFDHIYKSPTPAIKPGLRPRLSNEKQAEAEMEGVEEIRRTEEPAPLDPELDIPPFKPALINFHRNNSDHSTPTPGSVMSEASFEGGAPEDYFRVYGRPAYSYSPIDLGAYVTDEPEPHPLSQPIYSPGPESPFEQPPSRMSTASSTTQSTITSTSSSSTITSLHSSSSGTLAAQIRTAGTALMSRPSLLRPRPRKHPYDGVGGRQKEAAGGRGYSFGEEEASMRDDGRSVSEVMVAMAGLRCQRGRAMRG